MVPPGRMTVPRESVVHPAQLLPLFTLASPASPPVLPDPDAVVLQSTHAPGAGTLAADAARMYSPAWHMWVPGQADPHMPFAVCLPFMAPVVVPVNPTKVSGGSA